MKLRELSWILQMIEIAIHELGTDSLDVHSPVTGHWTHVDHASNSFRKISTKAKLNERGEVMNGEQCYSQVRSHMSSVNHLMIQHETVCIG